jgi:hypothetical protein
MGNFDWSALMGNILAAVVSWMVLSLGVAYIAGLINKSKSEYFLLSILASPFVGFIAVLLPSAAEPRDKWDSRCPFCKEGLTADAVTCPHCTTKLNPAKQQKDALERKIARESADQRAKKLERGIRGAVLIVTGALLMLIGLPLLFSGMAVPLSVGLIAAATLMITFGINQTKNKQGFRDMF